MSSLDPDENRRSGCYLLNLLMRYFRNAGPWVVVLALLASGCHKNGDVAKREAVKRGDAFMDQKKYGEAIIEYRKAISSM